MKLLNGVCFVLLAGMLLGCDDVENQTEMKSESKLPQTTVESAGDIKELGLEVRRMIKTPAADSPKQCKIVEMGHKPCGGPERYLLYSEKTMTPDEVEQFLQKLARYNKMTEQLSQKSGMVSDCKIEPQPTTVVRNGFCVPAEKNTM